MEDLTQRPGPFFPKSVQFDFQKGQGRAPLSSLVQRQ